MAEGNAVEAMNQTAASDHGVETNESQAPTTQGFDYAAELATLQERNAQLEVERENYKKAALKAKGKLPEDKSQEADLSSLVKKEVEKTVAAQTIAESLRTLSSDEKERALILHYFEGMNPDLGTITERMENAKLLANKKTFLMRDKEMQVALQNRSQVQTPTSMGAGTEGHETKSASFKHLSAQDVQGYKALGRSDHWIKLLDENIAKSKT